LSNASSTFSFSVIHVCCIPLAAWLMFIHKLNPALYVQYFSSINFPMSSQSTGGFRILP
jgi:hypothetical protein